MAATRSREFFCNVQSAVNVSNATRLMSQRPQREKLPASPDPLRCDVHVIKRVVWQFCNPQHTSSILEAVTVAQQNYHAIWECCSQSGNYLSQFRHDSVTHWTKGSFGQSDCVTNLMPIYIDQKSICVLNPRMWDDLNSNPWEPACQLGGQVVQKLVLVGTMDWPMSQKPLQTIKILEL